MNKKDFIKWLKIDEKKQDLYIRIPNEIFKDLGEVEFKNWKHKSFAYSYHYLISYLYRVTIYGNTPETYCQESVISSIYKKSEHVSYITKRNGLLDKMGYTISTSDFPVTYSFDAEGILQFYKFKALQKQVGKEIMPSLGGRFFIKEPVKAFIRFDDEDFTGTFYDAQNTHQIKVSDFIDIIKNDNLGYVGLYVYAYLVYYCNKFPNGYTLSNKEFSNFLGANERTVAKYTLELEDKGFIRTSRQKSEDRLFKKIYFLNN